MIAIFTHLLLNWVLLSIKRLAAATSAALCALIEGSRINFASFEVACSFNLRTVAIDEIETPGSGAICNLALLSPEALSKIRSDACTPDQSNVGERENLRTIFKP